MGEIRFVGTGETRGYPYPVCKKIAYIPHSDFGKVSLQVQCLQVIINFDNAFSLHRNAIISVFAAVGYCDSR